MSFKVARGQASKPANLPVPRKEVKRCMQFEARGHVVWTAFTCVSETAWAAKPNNKDPHCSVPSSLGIQRMDTVISNTSFKKKKQ